MNNIIHIRKSNAPPLVRGKPDFRKKLEVRSQKLEVKRQKAKGESQKSWHLNLIVISKEERPRDLLIQSSKVPDSSPNELGFGMTAITSGWQMLYLRDGSYLSIHHRDYYPEREEGGYICPPTIKSSVALSVSSAISTVNTNNYTYERQDHTRQHRAVNKGNPPILQGPRFYAGGLSEVTVGNGRVLYVLEPQL